MYLKYGDYQHASGEASVVISKQGMFTDSGIARGVRERWDIQGRLQAADPAALTTALDALAAAYAVQAQDVGFYFDNGDPSSHLINSSATNGGVRVAVPPSFPEGKGAEYSTFRNYTIALEAEWLDAGSTLLDWQESLAFRGGGAQFVFLRPLAGAPVKQLLHDTTTYHVTQSGAAVGFEAYPTPPRPIWPAAEHVDQRQITLRIAQTYGSARRGHVSRNIA